MTDQEIAREVFMEALFRTQQERGFFVERISIRQIEMGYQVKVGIGSITIERVFNNQMMRHSIDVVEGCYHIIDKLRKAHEKNS